jgi:hypothetical protein
LQKTESLKENDRTAKRNGPLVGRAARATSTLPSRPAATESRRSGVVTKPPTNRPELAYPSYNYADTIPKPKVIYIRNEENANEMVGSLNG